MEEENGVSALSNLKNFVDGRSGYFSSRNSIIKQFFREFPEDTQILIEQYDKEHQGWYHSIDRKTTSKNRKLKNLLDDSYKPTNFLGKVRKFSRKHPAVLGSLIFGQGLISSLSPTHPISVDAYFVDKAIERVVGTDEKVSQRELEDFLITEEQVNHYESDFLKDLQDVSSEKAFAIVYGKKGLKQKPIRTIHENLPNWVPSQIKGFLDRKHIPRLDDYVDLWLNEEEVVANGHYHVFGENPSKGDKLSGKLSSKPEIVVRNGIVPFIFRNGELVSYGDNIEVSDELVKNFGVRIIQDLPYGNASGPVDLSYGNKLKYSKSFFSFYNKFYGVDTNNLEKLILLLNEESNEFKEKYETIKNSFLSNNLVYDSYDINLSNFIFNQSTISDLAVLVKIELDELKDKKNNLISEIEIHNNNLDIYKNLNHLINLDNSSIFFNKDKNEYLAEIMPSYDGQVISIKNPGNFSIKNPRIVFPESSGIAGFTEGPFKFCYRGFIEFDTSLIPDESKITDVNLKVEVISSYEFEDTVSITRFNNYKIENEANYPINSLGDKKLFDDIGTGPNNLGFYLIGLVDFQTIGKKNIDLGANADMDLKSQLPNDFFGVGFVGSDETITGLDDAKTNLVYIISSGSSDTLSPKLRVTYTLPEGMTEHPGYQSKIQSTEEENNEYQIEDSNAEK